MYVVHCDVFIVSSRELVSLFFDHLYFMKLYIVAVSTVIWIRLAVYSFMTTVWSASSYRLQMTSYVRDSHVYVTFNP